MPNDSANRVGNCSDWAKLVSAQFDSDAPAEVRFCVNRPRLHRLDGVLENVGKCLADLMPVTSHESRTVQIGRETEIDLWMRHFLQEQRLPSEIDGVF